MSCGVLDDGIWNVLEGISSVSEETLTIGELLSLIFVTCLCLLSSSQSVGFSVFLVGMSLFWVLVISAVRRFVMLK